MYLDTQVVVTFFNIIEKKKLKKVGRIAKK